jgi:hypothetical protein
MCRVYETYKKTIALYYQTMKTTLTSAPRRSIRAITPFETSITSTPARLSALPRPTKITAGPSPPHVRKNEDQSAAMPLGGLEQQCFDTSHGARLTSVPAFSSVRRLCYARDLVSAQIASRSSCPAAPQPCFPPGTLGRNRS